MTYPSPYGRPRRRISLVIPVVAVLVALGIAAALFLPTYLTRRSLDNLIAQLPAGTTLTYEGATYGLFTDTVELRHVTYTKTTANGPALTATAGSFSLVGGNRHMDKDAAVPGLVKLASQVVIKDEGIQYGPLVAHADEMTVSNPQVDISLLSAPLAAPQPSTLATLLGKDAQPVLQLLARNIASIAYDRLSVEGFSATLKDPHATNSLVLKLAEFSVDGMNRGSYTGTATKGLDAQSGFLHITVDDTATGGALNAPFWQAILEGKPLETALQNFQGASEQIHGVHVLNATSQLGSLAGLTVGSIGYDQSHLTALAASMDKLELDLDAIPVPTIRAVESYGYKTLLFDGALAYHFDPATRLSTVDNTTLTLDQGGKLSLTASFLQPPAGAGATGFVPATPKLVTLTLRYDDAGLFGRVLDQQAKASGQPADIVRQNWIAQLEQGRQGLEADPVSGAALDQMEKFIASPTALTITLTPPAPIGFTDLDQAHPEQFAAQLGLALKAE